MIVKNGVLIDITNKDIVDGKFVIPYSVEAIGDWAFESCTSLTSIVIPPFVERIGGLAFWNCTSLESIIIPDSIEFIGYKAFMNCTSLSSIIITTPNTEFEREAFKGCHSLNNIIAPEHIKKEIEWQVTISKFAQPNEKIAQKFQEWKTKLQE